MAYFEYEKDDGKAEYYELLQELMERWEYEIVEFKSATGGYSEDKIGQYVSAISNEPTLRASSMAGLCSVSVKRGRGVQLEPDLKKGRGH